MHILVLPRPPYPRCPSRSTSSSVSLVSTKWPSCSTSTASALVPLHHNRRFVAIRFVLWYVTCLVCACGLVCMCMTYEFESGGAIQNRAS